MSGERLSVGYIAGAHGIRGGVRVKLHNPGSSAFAIGSTVVLVRDGAGEVGRYAISKLTDVPGKPDLLRVRLEGVTTRNDAEALQGCAVEVDRAELPPLAADEFYLADAIGLPVLRGDQNLGTVVGVTSNGAQQLFEIEYRDAGRAKMWLLPILPGFVLEVSEARVLVDVPPGMLPEELES
jgi:16S rRNA processing protein RimM